MNEPIDYDALLSRVLDGEATPAERAQVAADGSLTARLDLLRRTQQRLAEPPPALDAATVDELVARAMRELPMQAAPQPVAAAPTPPAQSPPAAAEPLAPVPPPTSLAAHREKKRRTPVILSVAAAVLVVLLAVPVIASLAGDDGSDRASDGPAEVAEAPGAGQDETADAAEADGAMQEADDLDQVAGLLALADTMNQGGEIDDEQSAAVPTTTAPSATGEGVPDAVDPLDYCRGALADDHPELNGDEVRGALIRFRGEDAVAYLYEVDGDDTVLVASADTCDILDGPAPA